MSLDIQLQHPKDSTILWEGNITYNLCGMAKAAGVYTAIYHPDWSSFVYAKDLKEPLATGLNALESAPEKFNDFSIGWGTSEHLIDFIKEYLEACAKFPDAYVVTI